MENTVNREMKICQSCGMPMQEEQYGTNQDGSKNDTYCCYCYKDGASRSSGRSSVPVSLCFPWCRSPFVLHAFPYRVWRRCAPPCISLWEAAPASLSVGLSYTS